MNEQMPREPGETVHVWSTNMQIPSIVSYGNEGFQSLDQFCK